MKLKELLRMIDPRTIVSVGIKMLNGEFWEVFEGEAGIAAANIKDVEKYTAHYIKAAYILAWKMQGIIIDAHEEAET